MTTLPSFHQLLEEFPVRAGAFIVTLYGDVAAPRGGQLWMGNIIETCAAANISESRVRTAVSRLVAAGQIESERDGRRSFYQLTPDAVDAFQKAARKIYKKPKSEPLVGWHVIVLPQGPDREKITAKLSGMRFGFPVPGLAILPDRGQPLPAVEAVRFAARTEDNLSEIAQNAWPLDELNAKAERFVSGFEPFLKRAIPPAESLALRLLLVHIYREIALSDPELPAELLPSNWKGRAARDLFAALYLKLSDTADAEIAERFVDSQGPLKPISVRLARRIADLSET